MPTRKDARRSRAAVQRGSCTAWRRERLASLRVAVGKVVILLLGLLCGASIGREGPTVQVGASIMFAIGRLSPRRQPGLLLAGASAGVAAAFNTPLAGIVFGIEEMSCSFEARTSGIILGAVIAAGLTSLSLQGDDTYFGTTSAVLGELGRVCWPCRCSVSWAVYFVKSRPMMTPPGNTACD